MIQAHHDAARISGSAKRISQRAQYSPAPRRVQWTRKRHRQWAMQIDSYFKPFTIQFTCPPTAASSSQPGAPVIFRLQEPPSAILHPPHCSGVESASYPRRSKLQLPIFTWHILTAINNPRRIISSCAQFSEKSCSSTPGKYILASRSCTCSPSLRRCRPSRFGHS